MCLKDARKRWVNRYAAVSALILCSAMAGEAQVALERRDLKLVQAVQLALKQNSLAVLARLQIALVTAESRLTLSRLLPQAALGARQQVERFNIEVPFSERLPGVPQHIGPYQTTIAGPQFSTPVFDLTLWRRYQASKSEELAAKNEELTTREEVTMLVVSQYLGCLRARASQTASESRVRLAQELSVQADDLLQNGAGTSIDALRAKVQLQDEQQQLINAKTATSTALYTLAQILNLPAEEEPHLQDEMNFFDLPEFKEVSALDLAFVARPELKALEQSEFAARRLEQAARAERLPTVTFEGDWTEAGLRWNTSIPSWTFRGSFLVPIFTSGQIHSEVLQAQTRIRQIEEQIRNQRAVITQQVRTALIQLTAARKEVDVATSRVKLANEEILEARHRFEAGVTNNLEVTSAQDSLARANDNQIAALYRYNQARADLFRSTGQLEQMYAH